MTLKGLQTNKAVLSGGVHQSRSLVLMDGQITKGKKSCGHVFLTLLQLRCRGEKTTTSRQCCRGRLRKETGAHARGGS